MKLSLIREATIDQVQKRIPIWTKKHFGNDEQKALEQIPNIIAADPTKGKYSEWLVKQWKDGTARFPEDTEKLAKNLQLFHQKKSKLQDKDINRYTPSSLAQTIDQQLGLTKSERKSARKGEIQLPPGAEIVLETGPPDEIEYTVVKITTPEASSLLCSGTQWCVANEETADEYLKDGPLYLIYYDNKREYLVHYESDQFMDIYDEPVETQEKSNLINLLEPVTGLSVNNNPNLALWYAVNVIKRGFSMARFPEGEAAIAKDPTTAVQYARDVIKGRWPEGEATILKDPWAAVQYARDVIKGQRAFGRWPEGEATILKDPKAAYKYAKNVLKRRWPEGEAIILSNLANPIAPRNQPVHARLTLLISYAKFVIKGRWPEAEEAILQIPEDNPRHDNSVKTTYAFLYARDVIKGRWPEAEAIITKDPIYDKAYTAFANRAAWPFRAEGHDFFAAVR